MKAADRFRLLGSYTTPCIRLGEVIACEARDCDLVVVEISDGRIPWPVGRRKGQSGKSLVVFGDLALAIQTESNQAICHWWGVTPQTVSKWRKAFGVKWTNGGTRRLRVDYSGEPWFKRARRKAHAKANDPERRRRISEAKKGKPRPGMDWTPNGIEWTKKHDRLVRTRTPAEVVKLTGHTLKAVWRRRHLLGVTRKLRRR
jgi:hypothetical protein